MKLSTKARYGMRLMLDVASHYGQKPGNLRTIARRQDISEKYLWQLASLLKNAGLIKSTRGPAGGYKLARPPSEITLKDIVSVLQGPVCVVDCINDPDCCRRSQDCIARGIWKKVNDNLLKTLDSVTLETVVSEQKAVESLSAYAI
jgi:Rrf2 family transcriptional regulator, cysteine metabolism repressor